SSNTRFVTLGRVNGDTNLDMIAASADSLNVFLGNGDGTFQPRADYPVGSADPYQVALVDFNGDAKLDVAIASYGNNQVITLLNNGDGTFGNQITMSPGGNPISIAPGDFDGDGRTDLAIAHYTGNRVSIWLADRNQLLAEDPPGSGIRSAFGRGSLSDTGDADHWSFTGNAGDRLVVAVEIPGSPPASQLLYEIFGPDGTRLTYFYPDYYGWGQLAPTTLP